MIDTKQQKIERTQEDMFHHLENNKLKPKFSIGVWYFFPGGGRFHESYIRKESIEVVINKIKSMKDSGIVDSGFGVEAH